MIFWSVYLRLKPRTPVPNIRVEFYPFAGLSHTARLRNGCLAVRLSDVCIGAPPAVFESLALILLARLYRKRVDESHHRTYRKFVLRSEVQERTLAVRHERGRSISNGQAQGRHFHLDAVFDGLNEGYFGGALEKPKLFWTAKKARYVLGRYDSVRKAIFVSRLFDSPDVPRYVVDYVMYHEMLHLKHQSCVQNGRLIVHTPEFQTEERSFSHYRQAKDWLNGF